MNACFPSPNVLAALLLTLPIVSAADEQAPAVPVQTGTAPFLFATVPGWGTPPPNIPLGPTHGGLAVDRMGNVYVATDGRQGILIFDRSGNFQRAIAPEFSGTHSLLIRQENGVEYLYGVHLRRTRIFKMTLTGKPIFILGAPKEAGIYGVGGEGYKPTAIAVGPDQSLFVADGYGSNYIHKYNAQGKYVGSFGGSGKENGKFMNCIGLAIDTRARDKDPSLLVCDRDNRRIQRFDLDGQFIEVVLKDLAKPTSLSIYGQYLAVAENEARVTVLNGNNEPVAFLGDNSDRKEWGDFKLTPDKWKEGVFVSPHSLAWDQKTGSLYVQDWSTYGRLTKLDPVASK